MINHLLIITRDLSEQEGILDEVTNWATDRDGTVKEDTWVRSAEDARSKLYKSLASDFDLVITRLDIALTRKTPLNHADDLGLEIIREMRDRDFDAPAIIIADEGDLQLFEKVKALDRCELVSAKQLSESLAVSLDQLLHREVGRRGLEDRGVKRIAPTEGEDEKGVDTDVEIVLKQGKQSYRISGPVDMVSKDLNIDEEFLERLRGRTTRLNRNLNDPLYADWDGELQDIGWNLRRELFASPNFAGDFKMAIGAAGGRLSNTHLRFSVEKDAYALALEALYGDKWKWWMLEAPITRRLESDGWADPLFRDPLTRDQPVRLLVIQANVEGFVWLGKNRHNLERLENVPAECKYLRRLSAAETVGKKIKISNVVSIPDERGLGDAPNFRARVKAVLTGETVDHTVSQGRFHIVHFAGHSIYDEATRESYLVFPGEEEGDVDLLPAGLFADWLKTAGTRFVYLSCCKGSEAVIVHELAERGVPAILGFRWDIDDDMAATHARSFYDQLLKGRPSLEDAFLKARKNMYEQDHKNRIWAAPIMILQTNDGLQRPA